MIRLIATALAALLALASPAAAQSTTRIKDISSIQGVRDNQLVGYGLIIGLQARNAQASLTVEIAG
ncbi:flagellar basal body P-ring protein FlgI [Xanthobacter flavus]